MAVLICLESNFEFKRNRIRRGNDATADGWNVNEPLHRGTVPLHVPF